MDTPQMVIFPWVALKDPIAICGVDILPRTVAIERAGTLGENVTASTSYFYDHRIEGAPQGGHPLALVPVNPSVVLLDASTTREKVETASLVWLFSVIFGNDSFTYANSTTFQHFYQNLGGDAGIYARRTRRMHGHKLDGSLVINALDVKPRWCGEYHSPDRDMLPLLESVIDLPDATHVREALDALRLATKDDDTEPAEAEHAHYARAAERLLHRSDQERRTRRQKQEKLAEKLLQALLPPKTKPDNILLAMDAVREQRNDFWHPETSKRAKVRFEKQVKVHPNLIAFRMIAALIIASIRELVQHPLADRLETYPSSVELWLSRIEADEQCSAEDASNLGKIWSDTLMQMHIERFVAEDRRRGGRRVNT